MSGACLGRKGSPTTQQNQMDPQTQKQPTEDQIPLERSLHVEVHMHDQIDAHDMIKTGYMFLDDNNEHNYLEYNLPSRYRNKLT
jgi:hypothetical protein